MFEQIKYNSRTNRMFRRIYVEAKFHSRRGMGELCAKRNAKKFFNDCDWKFAAKSGLFATFASKANTGWSSFGEFQRSENKSKSLRFVWKFAVKRIFQIFLSNFFDFDNSDCDSGPKFSQSSGPHSSPHFGAASHFRRSRPHPKRPSFQWRKRKIFAHFVNPTGRDSQAELLRIKIP